MMVDIEDAKPGDVILLHSLPYFNPFHALTGLIHLICGSVVVHCGMVIKTDIYSICWLETNPGGSRIRTMSFDDKRILNYSIQRIDYGDKQITDLAVYNLFRPYSSMGYSYLGILNLLLNHAIGRFKDVTVYKNYIVPRKNTMICSQLVASMINKLSGKVVFKNPSLIQPDDFINLKF